MNHTCLSGQVDKPWWLLTSNEKFLVNSAWELLRIKDTTSDYFRRIWVKGLPFKISFLVWRLWKAKIPVAAILARWNPSMDPSCRSRNSNKGKGKSKSIDLDFHVHRPVTRSFSKNPNNLVSEPNTMGDEISSRFRDEINSKFQEERVITETLMDSKLAAMEQRLGERIV
ncbi:hypothetical protein KY289_013630 [Solanum tuberosum]|nr:hypothetical protein KY289_013630 [Solanum tuberosum]